MASERNRLGVVGHPIKHSLSPVMHNAALQELGLYYIYEAFDVEESGLPAFIEECRRNFIGLNVTTPHKVAVTFLVDELSREADLIGAVNTIKFTGDKAVGFNTDGVGCINALKDVGVSVRGCKVVVLGAGGAARAIVYQCVLEGAEVSIANRSHEKALKLAGEVSEKTGKFVEVVEFSADVLRKTLDCADILINATSVGMHPKTGETPIPVDIIPRDITVMDAVYNPLQTRLLYEAWVKGCRTINGVGMLVHQGAEAFRIWFGINPPLDVMEESVLKHLKEEKR